MPEHDTTPPRIADPLHDANLCIGAAVVTVGALLTLVDRLGELRRRGAVCVPKSSRKPPSLRAKEMCRGG